MNPPSYTVVDHLLDRLAGLGVGHIFGVPGDFTLTMLDRITAHPSVVWVGCAAELGAGYAADGYARARGLGVVCTTFGVGELSAVNAAAGAYAEHVPLLHVVGAPATATQRAARPTHHSLGDGDFRHFLRMHSEVTCVQSALTLDNAAAEIDHVLAEILRRRLPGYIVIPADVGLAEAERSTETLAPRKDVTNARALERFRDAARPLVNASANAAVLADILVERFGAEDSLHALLSNEIPHATLLWGRRVVDESAQSYAGIYVGAASGDEVRSTIEDADLLVEIGVQFTDLTSGFFSQHIPSRGAIVIDGTTAAVDGTLHGPIAMADAIDAVADLFRALSSGPNRVEHRLPTAPKPECTDGLIG
nr:thiamine pyrophosphate-binding protein [Rhodococcus sp. (in: high G+C Gram-positive bacteria)]